MNTLHEIIHIDKASDTPVYLQITNSVICNIRRGKLRRGTKLPGARELSETLKIHRKTLQNAYDELMAQGWVEIVPRIGTFVANKLPDVNPIGLLTSTKLNSYPEKTLFSIDEKNLVRFSMTNYQGSKNIILDNGFPDIRLAPTELLLREYRSLAKLQSFKQYLKYGSPRGSAHLLEMLSIFLTDTRGLPITSNNLLITRGAQMGIYLTTKLLIRPNDQVIVGQPGYNNASLTFLQAGAILNNVPVDEYGLDVDAIDALCQKKKIRMVYVISHHHYPTSVTLCPERRIRLLELAARYKFAIIEDDYDYDFHYHSTPVLPMASLDYHGNVIYIGTLTKTLAPAIRLGFIIAPENFIDAVAHLRRSIDWQGDSMMEAAIAELYKNGTIGRHIKKVVKMYHERRDHFCELLTNKLGDHVSFKIPDGGMSVWVKFIGTDLKLIAERAATNGLTMSNGCVYNSDNINYNATRLGFASLNFKEQDKAIDILAKSI
jgi:GntR family transcriptional regulator/MocR family aminotransferase